MGKWTQVTEKDFRQVKLLTDAGISTSKISEITKRRELRNTTSQVKSQLAESQLRR